MSAVDPLVSLVVPSWDKGRFLRRTLESLLQQTYPHVEIIVQDNLSTDETVDILKAYAPRLTRVVRERDAGQSDALRRGYAHANGQILGWLNADDLLMPDAVERVVAAFQAEPQPDVVYGHCAMLTEDGQFLRYFHEAQPFSAEKLCNRINFIAQPSTFFSRRAYDQIGGLDVSLHFVMDWDLWCRFAKAGCQFRFVEEVLSAALYYHQTKTGGGGMKRLSEILSLNRRYKTTRLPIAAAAHAYQDLIIAKTPVLHTAFRWLWRLLTGRRYLNPITIHGLAFPDRLVSSPARIRFPLFSNLTNVHLRLIRKPEGGMPRHLQVTLNGHTGIAQHDEDLTTITWRFTPPAYAEAVDLEIQWESMPKDQDTLQLLSLEFDRMPPPLTLDNLQA